MGKLTSYLLGLTAAILLVYYVLYVNYLPLINWLGPTVGSDIIFPFGFLFLLLGNPISYPVVLLSWAAIGMVIAVGSRKGTKAIGSAIGIYFTLWGFLALSLVSMAQKITGGSIFGGTGSTLSIPPIPPGTSISTILAAPIISSFSSLATSIPGLSTVVGGTGGGITTSSILGSFSGFFYNTLLPGLIINIMVLLVVSGLLGTFIHRAIHKSGTSGNSGNGGNGNNSHENNTKVRKVKVKKVIRKASSNRANHPEALLAILLVIIVVLSTGGALHQSASAPVQNDLGIAQSHSLLNASISTGNLIFSSAAQSANVTGNLSLTSMSLNYGGGFVGKYGNVYNLYAFLNETAQQPPAFFGSTVSNKPILSAIFASSNLESIFNSLKQDGVLSPSTVDTLQSNQLYNVIPQALIIEVYSGSVNSTSSSALQAARTLSTNMGGTSPAKFLSLDLPLTNNTNDMVSLFAYSLGIPSLSSESTAANALSPYFYQDGMLPAFTGGLGDGYLIPGQTPGSVNGSVFLAGHVDLSSLPASLHNLTNFISNSGNISLSGNIYFMGGLFVKQNVIHSSAARHVITGDQVFNYNNKIMFGSNQSIYAVSVMYPDLNLSTGSPVTEYSMVMYSNFQNFTGFGTATNFTFIYVPSGSGFYFTNISLPTNVTFPANVKISQSVTHISGNSYEVKIRLTNNDTDSMGNVQLNAAPLLTAYGSYASVANGTPEGTASMLQPGQSLVVEYNLTLNGIGTYVVATPIINYTLNGSAFSVLGNTLTASVQNPSVFHAFNQVEFASFSTISNLLHFTFFVKEIFNGFYVFDLIILLIVALAGYIEYRAFNKWRLSRRRGNASPAGEEEEAEQVSEETGEEDT